MAKIAYVDHSYHKKTVSTKFIPEALTAYGHKVDFFWDEAWCGGKWVDFDTVKNYDAVIMFQSYCSHRDELFFKNLHPNITYIPMLDQFGIWNGPQGCVYDFWLQFQGVKVINFSNICHGMTVGMGIRSELFRFFRPPSSKCQTSSGLNGFLWIRMNNQISWQLVKRLIGNTKFDSFHLHVANDPSSPKVILPSEDDMRNYNITVSNWFEDKADFEKVLAKANVYFAPRMEEGIGQSFLEAFARGQCVVAPNNGTMNEYIQHGFTGLLFDAHNPRPLDFSDALNIGQRAYEANAAGYKAWLASRADLVNFILTPNKEAYKGHFNFFSSYRAHWHQANLTTLFLHVLRARLSRIRLARLCYRGLKNFKNRVTGRKGKTKSRPPTAPPKD